jgi:peptide/nickel transport system substrate-binding protein
MTIRGFLCSACVCVLLACGGIPPSITIALKDDPSSLDPHLDDFGSNSVLLRNIYEPLVAFTEDQGITPCLAREWNNTDDRTCELELRPGVRFHDGTALTAEDARFSLLRARDDPRSRVAEYLFTVQTVEAAGPLTLRITTREPDPALLNKLRLVMIVPQGRATAAGDAVFGLQPCGTGPYRFAGRDPDRSLRLEAHRDYWGAPPRVKAARWIPLEDSGDRLAALLDGRADLAHYLNLAAMEKLQTAPGLRAVSRSSLTMGCIGFNTQAPPFDRLPVREAVYRAVDAEALVRERYKGRSPAATQLFPPGVQGHDPSEKRLPHDPERARALLAAAGFPQGLDLVLDITRQATATGELLRAQMLKSGIRVTFREFDTEELNRRIYSRESACFYIGYECSSGDGAVELVDLVHSGPKNMFNTQDPALDRLIEEALAVPEPDKRIRAVQRAQRAALALIPAVPLFVVTHHYGIREGVDWTPRADDLILVSDITLRR